MTAAAPGSDPTLSRWQRIRPPVLLASGLLLASIALHLRDPHAEGSYGLCPWLALTGAYCPGCGGLRAVNDLTRGAVLDAVSSNLLVVAAVPVAVGLWLRSVRQRWTGARRPLPPRVSLVAGVVALVAVLVFWVLRNLPAGTWLTP